MAAERLTDEELAEFEDRATGSDQRESDAEYFGTRRLVAEVRASRALLAELEWSGERDGQPVCPACGGLEAPVGDLEPGHHAGCKLASMLGREEHKSDQPLPS